MRETEGRLASDGGEGRLALSRHHYGGTSEALRARALGGAARCRQRRYLISPEHSTSIQQQSVDYNGRRQSTHDTGYRSYPINDNIDIPLARYPQLSVLLSSQSN
jgi:hypothetical protein